MLLRGMGITWHVLWIAGHLQDHFNQQSWEDKCSGTVQVLIDMELLAHTNYFVGSYNSRCTRLHFLHPSLVSRVSAAHIQRPPVTLHEGILSAVAVRGVCVIRLSISRAYLYRIMCLASSFCNKAK